MTSIVDVSSKLGEYMLRGWVRSSLHHCFDHGTDPQALQVLTDRTCSKCSKVPLMRSPTDSTIYFCANCDGGPPSATSSNATARPTKRPAPAQSDGSSSASMDSASHRSRPSTPLTEMSSTLSSPTFAPVLETAEMLRRRQQSDTASAEIGSRLLKGWAMLADECPNTQCYGIPLVRPPKSGPEKDPRKVPCDRNIFLYAKLTTGRVLQECVICHTVYIDAADGSGLQQLAPASSSSRTSPATTARPTTNDLATTPSSGGQNAQVRLCGHNLTRIDNDRLITARRSAASLKITRGCLP